MDAAAIQALATTNFNPVSPDLIDNVELLAVISGLISPEATQDATVPSPLTFQAAQGTIYTTTLVSTTVTVDTTGDVIGWEMIFPHNAASLTLTGATLLNPESYVAGGTNYIQIKVIDNSTAIAWIIGVKQVPSVVSGTSNFKVNSTFIISDIGGNRWINVVKSPSGGNEIVVSIGDITNLDNGTKLVIHDQTRLITFQNNSGAVVTINVANGQMTLENLASTQPDGTPVKMVGVTAAGLLVKDDIPGGASFTKYKGEFADLAELIIGSPNPDVGDFAVLVDTGQFAICSVDNVWSSPYKGFHTDLTALDTAHPNPAVGDFAFLTGTQEWAVCLVATTWQATTLDAYSIDGATLTALEDETNWTHQNIYSGPAITANDLVAGKRAIHSTEPGVFYECLPGSPADYWVRKGNRVPATLKYSLGATGVDATADTSVAKDTDYLEAAFIPLSAYGNAGAVLPAGGGAVLDIHRAGATVFATTKVEIADGTATGTQTIEAVEWAAGSKIEVFIDSVPATPGQGYKVAIKGFWKF